MLQGCSGVSMRCEVWKVSDRRFDPQNYAKTFKAPLDMLVHDGYIEDDSWKFVEGITYAGGGPSALHRFKASKGDLETLQLLGLSNALDQIVGQGEGFSGTCDAVFKRRASVDGGSAGVRANDILIRILVHPSQR